MAARIFLLWPRFVCRPDIHPPSQRQASCAGKPQVAMITIQTSSLNPFQKVVATLLGLATLVLGVMFSVVLIPVVALLGAIGVGYFWWKTRALRKAMADIRSQRDADIIEGEAVVVREYREVRRLEN
ncbi:DUF1664 domain-containing protein [Quatrionicoccus australiensis]|uniref:DUF1664 domain-containing protein n=1 Tax=Quatrionicoccus australiensis TaxID=138118 RepID=UPI001CF8FC3C|nr:DUF1664 domain-containing protein [Quatrionicoccus australiensis]UCV16541.1 hypothetical protein KI612_07530 [Quatrionicoccus australiensis]